MKRITRSNSQTINSKFNKRYRSANRLLTSTVGTIMSLILFVSMTIISLTIFSDSTYAVSSALSLSIDNSTVSMSVSPTNVNGSFNKSSASTISASTNNATGYTLSITALSSSGNDYDKLINGSDNTAMLNSITSATTEEQFKALNATSYNGMWGYLPSKHCVDGTVSTCTNNTDFLPAPTTSGDVLDVTAAANTASSNTADLASTANTYSLTIGARVDSSVKSGAYTNAFLVTAVANPITYSIFYNDATITNMPADINTGISMTDTVNISNSTPTKQGYTFLGWCTVEPVLSGFNDTCTGGTEYQPNDPYILNQTSTSNTLGLYAMWKRNTMQNVAEWGDTIPIGGETTAIDSRDGKTYSVARLCMSAEYRAGDTIPSNVGSLCPRSMLWMTQNLDLVLGPAGVSNINSTNSDINQDLGLNYGYGIISNNVIVWTPATDTSITRSAAVIKHNNGHTSDAVSGWNYDHVQPQQAEGGDYYIYTSDTAPISGNSYDISYSSLADCVSNNHTEEQCRHYHIGNYYNWPAAVAMNNSGSYTSDLYVMSNSICPKGWRLPNGLTGTDGNETISEYNQLALANGITNGIATTHTASGGTDAGYIVSGSVNVGLNYFRSTHTNDAGYQAPMYFVRSGYVSNGAFYNYSLGGAYWTSTLESSNDAYNLGFASVGFYPANSPDRALGQSIRCVARD